MRQVFTNENRILAMNSKNFLENEGISVKVKNEHTAGAAIPGHQVWLELWVDELDYDKAIKLLSSIESIEDKSWVCSKCNEKNDGAFKICWNCQSEYS